MTEIKAPFPLVVEGPDGAGKTTLIRQLQEDFHWKLAPRFSTSTGGPLDDIYHRTMSNMSKPTYGIYDRHPVISEPIYALNLERPLDPGFMSIEYHRMRTRFFTGDPQMNIPGARLILCLPPKRVIRKNLRAEVQLAGVEGNIGGLIQSYKDIGHHISAGRWPGWAYLYDYTKPHAYELLKENLCQI